MINIKRIYEPPAAEDGYRLLVDRLWPRGLSREAAAIDAWLKELAPSAELRRWFQHDPKKWPEFKQRYFRELESNTAAMTPLRQLITDHPTLTFLYATKEETYNNAAALKEYVERTLNSGRL